VAAAKPDTAVPVGGYFIQVAAVSDRERAGEIAEMVAGRIEPAGALWRVRKGPYKSEADATSALAQVRSDGYQDARLVLIPAGTTPREGSITR
jgi:rare lipoprotein A